MAALAFSDSSVYPKQFLHKSKENIIRQGSYWETRMANQDFATPSLQQALRITMAIRWSNIFQGNYMFQ
jgi:hypothetical protein